MIESEKFNFLFDTQQDQHPKSDRLKNLQALEILESHSGFIHKFKEDTGLPEPVLRDLYTDTALTVLTKIEKGDFRGDSKISTYFYKIFYFKAVDYMRKSAKNKIDYLDTLPDHRDDSQDIEKAVTQSEESIEMISLLEKMCPVCRKIITQWAYLGFSNQELGESLGEQNAAKIAKIKFNCIEKFKKLWNNKMSRLNIQE